MDHSGHEPERNRHECRKTTISLTTRRSVLRIGHALLTLLRLGVGRPVHLHLDDTGLVSGRSEMGNALRSHGSRQDRRSCGRSRYTACGAIRSHLPANFPGKTSALGSAGTALPLGEGMRALFASSHCANVCTPPLSARAIAGSRAAQRRH